MTSRLLIIFILALYFAGCSNNKKPKLTVIFDRVDNLKEGSEVYYKGVPVGEVTEFELFRDSVLVEIKFTNAVKIPANSRFFINPTLVGISNISIEPSAKTTFLTSKDTVTGYYREKGFIDNMISDSAERHRVLQSIEKIGEGIKELVEAARDTMQKNK
jgi:ABC-type transporter Mla subunit MlaD